jgi:regulator of sirC expression with transglutaminase-like and TPR domain
MSERLSLTLFAHVCARPEPELDLGEAALLVAEAEYPGLDVARYVRALDDLARDARDAVAHAPNAGGEEARLEQVVRFFYEDAGFHGNDDDYYDPRNSFLHEVIDRRTGIPITLAVVLIEVCRRAGVDARGVSFPGHFLVRMDTQRGTILVDPFAGHPLTRDELRALYARATGEDRDPPPRLLEPATKAQILARILNNLRDIYERRRDNERLRGVLERVHVLAPSEALRQRIAKLGGSTPWRSGGGGVN